MSDFIFTIENVRKNYFDRNRPQTLLFQNINIERGVITVIKGETGIGKTTLLNMLGLMDQITFNKNDNITFFPEPGKAILYSDIYARGYFQKEKNFEKYRKEYFGFMFQHDHLIDGWTGFENISLPYLISNPGIPLSVPRKKAEELIEICQFFDMSEILDSSPATYSGGQRQRTALLRALIRKPIVIFADEPFASVPKKRAKDILKVLCTQAEKEGVTTIMVAHDTHDALLSLPEKNIKTIELEEKRSENSKIISVKKGSSNEK